MHDVFVRDIAVGEDHLIYRKFREQPGKFFLWVNGDTIGVIGPCKICRISAIGNEWDLCRSESNDLIGRTVSEDGIKIMEIPPGCA
jgi:hypothetical protein